MKRRDFLAVGAGLGIVTGVGRSAMAASSRRSKAVIDPAAAKFLAAFPQSAGMSIGVWRYGEAETFNYGVVRRGGSERPKADTIYPIASITKTFTGVLLAQTALDGKLKLDDDIRLYLDGHYPNLEFEGHPIRMYDLLDHRSGLPFIMPNRPELQPDFVSDVPWMTRIAALETTYSRAEFYADLHKITLPGVPGKHFGYSNAGATLAGYIIERVCGKPFETLLREGILTRLRMRDTAITLTAAQRAHLAPCYDGKGEIMPIASTILQGAGSINSCVHDMLKYAAWHVAETDQAVKLSHAPVMVDGNYSAGLNWQMLTSYHRRMIWQSGNFEGLHSYCILQPELKLALVALFNQADSKSNDGHGQMVNEILAGLDSRAILLP